MQSWSIAWLILAFLAAGGAVWVAGIKLSDTTDVLAVRLGLGEALGGLVLLAIATNLPELAITASAALANDLGIAVGNILGGIAIQTVVLAVLDVVGLGERDALSFRAASLSLVLEGVLVIVLLVVVVMGTQLPASLTRARIDPAALVVTGLWVAGLYLVGRARAGLPWHGDGHAPDSQTEPRGHSQADKERRGPSTVRAASVFAAAAVTTLIGGVVLEQTGEGIAHHINMTGVIFGATFLAAATALPEVSTGLASVKLGDYKLAFSDIFGGNAFLPVLFLLASLLSGSAVLPHAHDTDIYLTALGVLLTGIYIVGLIFRPRRQIAGRLGMDSALVLVAYIVGLLGLIAVTQS